MNLASGKLQYFGENLTSLQHFLCLLIQMCLFLWTLSQDVDLNSISREQEENVCMSANTLRKNECNHLLLLSFHLFFHSFENFRRTPLD